MNAKLINGLIIEANRVLHAIENEYEDAVVSERVDWLIEAWLSAGHHA